MTDAELLRAAIRPAVATERDAETGHVVLLRPRFRTPWVNQLLLPPGRRTVRVYLDGLGSFVWERLAAGSPLSQVASELRQAFPDEPHPEARVLLFVRQLLGGRLAQLCEPEAPASSGAATAPRS